MRAAPYEFPTKAVESAVEKTRQNPAFAHQENLPECWWLLFHDEQLNRLIEIAFSRNPDLQTARAKILLANANAARARATLYPTLNWDGDILREKLSETGIIPFNQNQKTAAPGTAQMVAPGGKAGIPVYFTQYETELVMNYDFDVWGKNRNTLKAALGEVKAKSADARFTQLQIGIAVASVYYDLQVLYQREKIAQELVKNKEKTVEIVEQRVKNHLNDQLTLNQVRANLSSAILALEQINILIEINENKLKAYLAGDFEEKFDSISILQKPLPKIPLPENLPLHLLANRPDIASQLWLIESAGRQIEVAKAGFYPDFNLVALFGFQTIHLHKLFNWPKSNTFFVDPAFSLPIFDGGRLCANLRASQINYDLMIYEYNALIINAAKEVLDAIARIKNGYLQLQQQETKKQWLDESLALSRLRIQHEVSSLLDYLSIQQNVLMVQDEEVQAWGSLIQANLSLIRALGGGCYE